MKTSISDRSSPDSINLDRPVNSSGRTAGEWLFRHRTIVPLPLAIAILLLRVGEAPASAVLIAGGVALTVAGEAVRLWGVQHIGVISRTRSDRLGPLVTTGPFAFVRNPLYLGNIALWAGFALASRQVWLVPVTIVVLAVEYHAIVRWEEHLLEARLGEAYRDYAGRVPRWLPTLHRGALNRGDRRDNKDLGQLHTSAVSAVPAVQRDTLANRDAFTWRETLFSERGTLIAIAVGYLLLWLKFKL